MLVLCRVDPHQNDRFDACPAIAGETRAATEYRPLRLWTGRVAMWAARSYLPIELVLAILLFTAAPGSLYYAVDRKLGRSTGGGRRAVQAITTALLALLDYVLLGPPPLGALSPLFLILGVSVGLVLGVAYYLIERQRLAWMHRDAVRTAASAWIARPAHVQRLLSLLVIALSEELLYRWYIVFILTWYGLVPYAVAIAISAVAYGVLHHQEGTGTMVSRGLMGLVMNFSVLLTGGLLVPLTVHVTYNALTELKPTRYVRIRKEAAT
jgi:membrane protease YdiL (CAAX protease family)